VVGAIEHFKPLLIGEDPGRTEHIWQTLFRGGFFPAQRILTAAISAIDIALSVGYQGQSNGGSHL